MKRNQKQERIVRWKLSLDNKSKKWIVPAEHLPAGNNIEWSTWRTLNRLRVGVGRSKKNQTKCGIIPEEDTNCNCEQPQIMFHLKICRSCPTSCTMEDIMTTTKEGIELGKFWQNSI
jgi:hypothetical protein